MEPGSNRGFDGAQAGMRRRATALRRWRSILSGLGVVAFAASALVVLVGGGTRTDRVLAASPSKILERPARDTTPTTTAAATAAPAPPAVSAPLPLPDNWLVLGDSVADSFADALRKEAYLHHVHVTNRARPGCGLISAVPTAADGSVIPWGPRCASSAAQYQQESLQRSHAQVVIWNSSWEMADHIFNGKFLALGTPEGDAALFMEIEADVARMTELGARVVLVTNAPRTPFNDIGLAATPDLVRRTERLNQILYQVADAHGDSVELVDLEQIVCPTHAPCPAFVDGVKLRPRDGSHFEGYGPGWLAPRLYAAIVAALTHSPATSS